MTNLKITIICDRLSCFREGKPLFRNINFTLNSSQSLLIIGQNGTGKSTLLKVLSGLGQAEEGALLFSIDNLLTDTSTFQSYIHFIPDIFYIKDEISVLDNIVYWSYLMQPSKNTHYHVSNATNALNFFKLDNKMDIKSKYLSLGQRKKMMLCRLLLKNNPVWVLDEPTIGLDSESIELLSLLMQMHQENDGIIIFSSHTNLKTLNINILDMG